MARSTYVIRDGQLVLKHLARPLHSVLGAGPSIISDGLDYVRNPADGQRYTSKAAYYRAVRRAGCEIVGNEIQAKHTPPRAHSGTGEIVGDIKRAIQELESR